MADRRIRVDYDNALAQATKLEKLAEQCQTQYRMMGKVVDLIPQIWCGRSGEQMQAICQAWTNKQMQQFVALNMEAGKIRQVVNDLREAEQRTIEEINGLC